MIRARVSLVLIRSLVFALSSTLVACGDDSAAAGAAGKEGPAGPTGPAGPSGANGDAGPAGEAGPAGPAGSGADGGAEGCQVPSRILTKWDSLPGLALVITGVSGGSGPDGAFKVGDTISVTFTVSTKAGECPMPLSELDGLTAWFTGPTSQYQRVLPIPPANDRGKTYYDASGAVPNPDGSYTYTFPDPIPATYSPPIWDTTKFSAGELTGKPLLDGTYTVAMRSFRKYTAEKDALVDPSTDLKHVLLGAATTIEERDNVTTANCNTCHTTMQRHSGIIRDVRLCITCHTAGAEDGSSTDTNDATPVTTEFGEMIHKIHTGRNLPSVLGVTTNLDGTRKYDSPPVPYVVGSGKRDFSKVTFPAGPSFRLPMPRDTGYSTLTAAQKALEDETRGGPLACDKCHGDPDGAGPLPAPKQGDLAYSKMTRRQCGSCHDDVDWTRPYVANQQKQPAQSNDTSCTQCHAVSGDALAVKDAHVHPLQDPALNPGLNFSIKSLAEAGSHNGNGKLDPGEKVALSFTIKNDANADVAASSLVGVSIVVSGPTTNRNLLLSNTAIPLAALQGPTYAINVPEPVSLEYVGTAANDTAIESFSTARTPHWNVTGAATDVYERTATLGGSTTTSAAAKEGQNFVDVASTSGFARNDYVVLDDAVAGAKEFRAVALVDGQRLWLSGPLRHAHAAGATAEEVTLVKKAAATAYTLAAATGTITEVAEGSIAAGNDVIVSYTSDFVMPSVYPPPTNDSPDLDETSGEWAGKALVPGTYTLGIWGSRNVVANAAWGADATSYKATSPSATKDFLVGSASTLVPYAILSSGDNCNKCHDDLLFHGGSRRGFDTCNLCHGNAGAEDRPRYVSANAPATPGESINFRSLVHKSHTGSLLSNPSAYQVVGYGSGAYPNNFTTYSYEHVVFPIKPNGVGQCTTCHGEKNTAWQAPASRSHPSQQLSPARTWKAACGTCHDGTAAAAHFTLETVVGGNEACAVCHGSGSDYDVAIAHKSW